MCTGGRVPTNEEIDFPVPYFQCLGKYFNIYESCPNDANQSNRELE